MAVKQGIRGIRQSIPSGFMIGRQSPGSSKGAPGLIPLPPLNQQQVIAGSGGKPTQGGNSGGTGTVSSSIVTVAGGTGINVTGAPAYTVALQVPVSVADGGTGTTSAGQLPATATNDNATAGNLGEYISSAVASGSGVNLTNITPATITSISLTAGDWDITATGNFLQSSAGIGTIFTSAISAVAATIPSTLDGLTDVAQVGGSSTSGALRWFLPVGPSRASIASTTIYYLVVQVAFGSGTVTGFGSIRARRVR